MHGLPHPGPATLSPATVSSAAAAAAAAQHRSTRGASKQRRDQINVEIQRLRDLLPLSESIKDRLFQLQVMSLACIFIRKHRYKQNVLRPPALALRPPRGIDPGRALRGFTLMMTRQGKILYISENASEYLGHSVEEIMCQGDSVYDLVDGRDHPAVQCELSAVPPLAAEGRCDERAFICRMNLSRTAKRQLQYHKFVMMQGRYLHPSERYPHAQPSEPVFAAFCQPLLNPENADSMCGGNTTVFSTHHHLDMRMSAADAMWEQQMGYTRQEMESISWYSLLHPDHLPEVATKHRLLSQEKEGSVLCLIRLQSASGEWTWLHTVLAVRGVDRDSEGRRTGRAVITATYQLLSELEASTLQANSWIYSLRHNYPAVFHCADSPDSRETPLSPASPFRDEKPDPASLQPIFGYLPPEVPFQQTQIKVEIPRKPSLSLFTPDHSSPDSDASSGLRGLLEAELLPATLPLPELRDDLDEFFQQVECAASSDSHSAHSSSMISPPEQFATPMGALLGHAPLGHAPVCPSYPIGAVSPSQAPDLLRFGYHDMSQFGGATQFGGAFSRAASQFASSYDCEFALPPHQQRKRGSWVL